MHCLSMQFTTQLCEHCEYYNKKKDSRGGFPTFCRQGPFAGGNTICCRGNISMLPNLCVLAAVAEEGSTILKAAPVMPQVNFIVSIKLQ